MLALVTALAGLLFSVYILYKPIQPLIQYFQRRWPDVLFEVPTKEKVVALTIDDAPSEYTQEILEILKANKATATFFVIGSQVQGRETVLQDLVCNRNELGNHAMEDEPSRSLSDPVLRDQIQTVQSKIHNTYTAVDNESPRKYFRPGSGFFSSRMRKVVQELGFSMVLGSVYPHDPQIPFWRVNARHILSMVRPGAIIICHDRRSWTAPMLRKVIPAIKRRGYNIVSVTELLKEADQDGL